MYALPFSSVISKRYQTCVREGAAALTGEPKTGDDRAGRTVWDMSVWLIIATPLDRSMSADAQTELHERVAQQTTCCNPEFSCEGDWSESDLILVRKTISVISKSMSPEICDGVTELVLAQPN